MNETIIGLVAFAPRLIHGLVDHHRCFGVSNSRLSVSDAQSMLCVNGTALLLSVSSAILVPVAVCKSWRAAKEMVSPVWFR